MTTARYNYKLRVGKQAETFLMAEHYRSLWVWNECAHMGKSGQRPTSKDLSGGLTEARSKIGWLRDGAQHPQAQTVRKYSQTLNRHFKVSSCGWPKYKSRRHALPSLGYTRADFSFEEGGMRLLKCPLLIPIILHRPLPSIPSSLTITRDNLGDWYASFVVRVEDPEAPESDNSIGIDWGVKETATTTDPSYDLKHSRHRKKSAAEVAKAQRKMSRRHSINTKQSRRYQHAKRQSARIQKRVQRRVKHEQNVWAKNLVENHQLIAVEDFKPKFLAKSTMARSSADGAIAQAKRILLEKAERAHRDVRLIQPHHTTMTCSRCFARAKQRLELSERIFHCDTCGNTDDRDRNAAKTILVTAEQNCVSVDDVRPELVMSGSLSLEGQNLDRCYHMPTDEEVEKAVKNVLPGEFIKEPA